MNGPLGATPDPEGVSFAIWSSAAEAVELCLFDAAGRESRRPLAREGDVWRGQVAGLGPGARYGFRAHGPWGPAEGLRFNPAKLLLDPYARALSGPFLASEALLGHDPDDPAARSLIDSAPYVPRSVVAAEPAPLPPGPRRPWSETVIYEAHPKTLTRLFPGLPPEIAGTCEAVARPEVIDHLLGLGVTALELLPVQAFPDDAFLAKRGARNLWGYNTIGYLAPEPRYFGPAGAEGFRAMAAALHEAGIELILDIVFNHTAEGDERGPTLSFRGLDNAGYYRLAEDRSRYDNPTGCGNALDFTRPAVIRLALDSLRHWAALGADGFRFDLAATLGRGAEGFSPEAPFLAALLADPLLSRLKLIAEPWDIGPGGYNLAGFPAPFAEWNDRCRDDVRRFWRGDAGGAQGLAGRLLGSADLFDRNGRSPFASVNFVTAHDGFTLADLTSFTEKRNEANGEGNRDGHGENLSDNCGAEGETEDAAVLAARALRRRSLLATLLLSQGVPMLLAGDEIGHSQRGNNNAWAQDNETTWIDWARGDSALLAFARRAVAYRAAHPALRQGVFLHGAERADGARDVEWLGFGGGAPDWADDGLPRLALILRGAAEGGAPDPGEEVLVAVNRGGAAALALPPGRWTRGLDSAAPEAAERAEEGEAEIGAGAVVAFHRARPAAPARIAAPESGALAALAAEMGVIPAFTGLDGTERRAGPETLAALLHAMGAPGDEAGAEAALAERRAAQAARLTAREAILDAGSAPVIPFEGAADWALFLEGESRPAAEGRGRVAALPPLPPGLHRLDLAAGAHAERMNLIAAPPRAPSFEALTGRAKGWGATAPLYGLASARNSGLGDYADLGALAEALAGHGAAFIGVNPVHAPGAAAADDLLSPYSPSHRGFYDWRHIAVGGEGGTGVMVDHAAALPRIRAALAAAEPDAAALDAFIAARGPALRRFALHEALSLLHGEDWRRWPAALHEPEGEAARAFAAAHEEELRRHMALQRLAEAGLEAAQARAKAAGMALGLYLDLAVGARPGGAETWGSRAHAFGVSLGAPPDQFAPGGQVWGLAPLSPEGLRAEGYATFAALLSAATRHAGMVRIDHVLGFARAFWAPERGEPGGYVRYPLAALLAVTRIVAGRSGAVVVGEDLGLVDPGLRAALAASGVLGADVMQFDWEAFGGDGRGRRLALASFATHDTPTLAGWFAGRDLDWRVRLGQIGPEQAARERAARAARREGFPGPLPAAVHRRLAASPATLVAVQLEDLAGAEEQANLPGTVHEHPNWRRRLAIPVEDWAEAPALKDTAAIMAEAGRGGQGETT